MIMRTIVSLLLQSVVFASVALAQGQPAAQPGFGEVFMRMLPMFIMVFFIFYFLVMKPQQAKLKAQQSLLSGLKKGDTVVTTSGLIGKIAGVEKDHVSLEVATNVRVKMEPSAIARKNDQVQGA